MDRPGRMGRRLESPAGQLPPRRRKTVFGPALEGNLMAITGGFKFAVTMNAGVIAFGSAVITGFVTRMYGNESRLMFHSSLLMLTSQFGLNFATHISFIFILLIPFGFASSVMRVVVAHLVAESLARPRERRVR